jgi:hypothetical protein
MLVRHCVDAVAGQGYFRSSMALSKKVKIGELCGEGMNVEPQFHCLRNGTSLELVLEILNSTAMYIDLEVISFQTFCSDSQCHLYVT